MTQRFPRALAALLLPVAVAVTAVLVVSVPGSAQDADEPRWVEGMSDITGDRMHSWVARLADDEWEGRNAGYDGNNKAARWLADHFKEWGLEAVDADEDHLQPFSFPVRGTRGQTADTQNVVGVIRGTDKADEVVVVGGHYDHVGKDGQANAGRMQGGEPSDRIWNGADDNASGTAGVLAVARAFANSEVKPRRTILFILFSAEEHGLLGARHYVRNPLLPIENTVFMLNMDMIGRNPDDPVAISGCGSSEDNMLQNWAEKAMEISGEPGRPSSSAGGGSDHAMFLNAKVPAVHFFTGFHPDYHRNSDHADKVSREGMQSVARLAYAMTAMAAWADERPVYRDGALSQGRRGGKPKMGILPDMGARIDKGVRCTSITSGSPADRAGMKAGDIVVGIGEWEIEDLEGLFTVLQGIKKGETHPVRILRDGEEVEVKIRFGWYPEDEKEKDEDEGRKEDF